MVTRSEWKWREISRSLWFRATAYSVLGVVAALFSVVFHKLIPDNLPGKIGADAVETILTILASSMLSVTTFTLSIMVASYSSSSASATPRATKLIMADSTSQNVLATFLGAFLFSLVGIIALKASLYDNSGRAILFVATLLVVLAIMVAILRWIGHLGTLGRLSSTLDRIEQAAAAALKTRVDSPNLGAMPLKDGEAVPDGTTPLVSERIGYVQHIDMAALQRVAAQADAQIFVLAMPGTFVVPTRPLAQWLGPLDAVAMEGLQAAFVIGNSRTYDQDARFGVQALAEAGQRALSSAINDSGTAIDVIGRLVRVLAPWAKRSREPDADVTFDRVHVERLSTYDLFDDAFTAIGRDGAALVEVGIRLQKALATLRAIGDARMAHAAREQQLMALERAEIALVIERDKRMLRDLVQAEHVKVAGP